MGRDQAAARCARSALRECLQLHPLPRAEGTRPRPRLRTGRSRISSRTEFPFAPSSGRTPSATRSAWPCTATPGSSPPSRRDASLATTSRPWPPSRPPRRAARRADLLGDDELACSPSGSPDRARRSRGHPARRLRPPGVAATRRYGGEPRHTAPRLPRPRLRVGPCRGFLRGAGVGRGDVVAVPMDRGLPWAVSVLAILKAGAVYLPQEPSDPPSVSPRCSAAAAAATRCCSPRPHGRTRPGPRGGRSTAPTARTSDGAGTTRTHAGRRHRRSRCTALARTTPPT
ncbi:AMP-binding protein [Streptomyces demainii]|uniref:AMP-binding protein n=1 Tax=Streptomyces demainii TaxID=588122 RepID=UPI00351C997E